jgi:hypothetical protein
MSKESIIKNKQALIEQTQDEINQLNLLETNRLYKIEDFDWDHSILKSRIFETWGFIECFNKESVRFCIVASNNSRYSDSTKRWRRRGNVTSFDYSVYSKLTHAKKDDLPLLVGLKYRHVELEQILKGTKRIKLDA